jgi:predicted AlkP superfamily pyrophosphatase or phosphodiesterase
MFNRPKFSGEELAKHVVVISLDAMSESDWDTISKLSNLSKMIASGSHTSSLKSVFPTHTYVVHTSMVTGVYPDKHGVIHNHQLQPFIPEEDQTWYWYQREIKSPTLYDLAKENHMKTAGLMWPVSAKSSIRYNMPELMAIR